MKDDTQESEAKIQTQKISLYLNQKRLAVLNRTLGLDANPISPQDAVYQIIDSWAEREAFDLYSHEREELFGLVEMLRARMAFQEEVLLNIESKVCSLKRTFDAAIEAPSDAGPGTQTPVSRADGASGPAVWSAHRTLASWLLETLTRVSSPQSTKIVAAIRVLPNADSRQPQYLCTQLLSVEGLTLPEKYESAIDRDAFGVSLSLDAPTYLVCVKGDQGSWEAQIRTKHDASQASTLIWKQEIKH